MSNDERLAGDKLRRNPDDEDGYLLTLRQVILLTLQQDTGPGKAVGDFASALTDAVYLGRPASDIDRVDVFEAWLMGRVNLPDANGSIVMQDFAEDLHERAPGLMSSVACARYGQAHRQQVTPR